MSTELTKEEIAFGKLLANQLVTDARNTITNRRKGNAKKK